MEELIKAYVEARKRNGMSKCKAIRHVTQQFIYVPRGKLVKVLIEGCKLNLRPSERNITSLTENGPSTSRQLGPKSVGRQGQSNPKSKNADYADKGECDQITRQNAANAAR